MSYQLEVTIVRVRFDDSDVVPTATGPTPRAIASNRWEVNGRGDTAAAAFEAAVKNGLSAQLEEAGK